MTYQQIKDEANHFFAHSANEMVNERKAIQHFVSGLLMKSSRRKEYKGFGYLTRDQVPAGKTFGVTYTLMLRVDESEILSAHTKPTFHDESRIFFY